jgi:betaine-homocysteine S-methyltransferase
VINLAAHRDVTREEWTWGDAAQRLEQAGADVVGLNCTRGPRTMMPILKQVRKAVKCHVSALPVPYRTTRLNPSFQSLIDKDCDLLPEHKAFPTNLDPFTCNRLEIGEFAKEAHDLGVRFLGVCCGAGPHHVRAMAEAVGRTPPASRYSADMSKHYLFGKTTLGKGKGLKEADAKYATTIAPGKR